MQKFAHRFLAHAKAFGRVEAIAFDCPRLLTVPFVAFVAACLVWRLWLGGKRPDIVHFGDSVVALLSPLCKLAGVPVVVTAYGLDLTYKNWLYQRLIAFSLARISALACISEAAAREAIVRGVPPSKVVVIRPGVDAPTHDVAKDEEKAEARAKLGLDPSSPVLITVGRLIERKGVQWFIEHVLPRLLEVSPTLRYVVVGDGPLRGQIDERSRDLGLAANTVLAGSVRDEALGLYLRAADLFVMPNVRVPGDMEGFGLVALEAGAAGLPVVAADLEGIRDAVIPSRNGVLVPSGDPEAFKQTILQLLDDRSALVDLANESLRVVRDDFSWAKMAREYWSLYSKLHGVGREGDYAESKNGSVGTLSYRRGSEGPGRAL